MATAILEPGDDSTKKIKCNPVFAKTAAPFNHCGCNFDCFPLLLPITNPAAGKVTRDREHIVARFANSGALKGYELPTKTRTVVSATCVLTPKEHKKLFPYKKLTCFNWLFATKRQALTVKVSEDTWKLLVKETLCVEQEKTSTGIAGSPLMTRLQQNATFQMKGMSPENDLRYSCTIALLTLCHVESRVRDVSSLTIKTKASKQCAVVVVYDRNYRIFVGKEPKSKPRAGQWAAPGGKLDPGETFIVAAARELKEEAALIVDPEDLEFYKDYEREDFIIKIYCIPKHLTVACEEHQDHMDELAFVGRSDVTGRQGFIIEALTVSEAWDPAMFTYNHSVTCEEVQARDLDDGQARFLFDRVCEAPDNTLRPSIKVEPKTKDQIFEEIQKGFCKHPTDDQRSHALGVGPEVVNIIEALGSNENNEIKGVHRHARILMDPDTKEPLPLPDEYHEELLNKANKIITKLIIKKMQSNAINLHPAEPPKSWNAEWKADIEQYATTLAERTDTIQLRGFVKLGEIQLPTSKLSRLVGDPGRIASFKTAQSVAYYESIMKYCFPHLITKGLTSEEVDEKITKFLIQAKKQGHRVESDDLSACDSSITLQDRERFQYRMQCIMKEVRHQLAVDHEYYDMLLKGMTPAGCEHKKFVWRLQHITVTMKVIDAWLFSGERETSISNRTMVLNVEAAELLRTRSEPEAIEAITAMWTNAELSFSIGDGDDNLMSFNKDMYSSREDRVEAYKKYYKLLDMVSSFEEENSAEVLSRFHIYTGDRGYFHIAKLNRNMARLTAFKHTTPASRTANTGGRELTANEIRMSLTDLWCRSFALRQTMVVRHFCRAMFEFLYKRLKTFSSGIGTTAYSADLRRLGHQDGDKRLEECYGEVLKNCYYETSTWAMVKVAHFGHSRADFSFTDIDEAQVNKEKEGWEISDLSWATLEIDDSMVKYPSMLLDSYPVTKNVALALGMLPELVEHCAALTNLGQASDVAPPPSPEPTEASGTGASENQQPTVAETEAGNAAADAGGGPKVQPASTQAGIVQTTQPKNRFKNRGVSGTESEPQVGRPGVSRTVGGYGTTTGITNGASPAGDGENGSLERPKTQDVAGTASNCPLGQVISLAGAIDATPAGGKGQTCAASGDGKREAKSKGKGLSWRPVKRTGE